MQETTGNHIKIQNGDILTVYAHCSELEVSVGDYIYQGQEIAKVGATRKSNRPTSPFRNSKRKQIHRSMLNFKLGTDSNWVGNGDGDGKLSPSPFPTHFPFPIHPQFKIIVLFVNHFS